MNVWGKSIPGRGINKCKGPEVSTHWYFQRTGGREPIMFRAVQRRIGDKVREVWSLEEKSRLESPMLELSALESNLSHETAQRHLKNDYR